MLEVSALEALFQFVVGAGEFSVGAGKVPVPVPSRLQFVYDKLAVFCSPLWTGVTRGGNFCERGQC